MTIHQPVLLKKVIKYLDPKPGENFIDCTLGTGGHSLAILKRNNPGKVLALDWDKQSLEHFKSLIPDLKIKSRLILVNDNFKNLKGVVKENNFKSVNGILFDLGLSSWQLEKSGKGFSFQKNEPLKMNFQAQSRTAKDVLAQSSKEELANIFKQYGEEKYSRRIAKAIKNSIDAIDTTEKLKKIIEQVVPVHHYQGRRGQIQRVLARIFQALRIATNDELDNLKRGIEQGVDLLESQGRMVVISFHSLEDRIVKHFFKKQGQEGNIEIITKKPVIADQQEIEDNSRSRSAKLRVIKKI